MATNDWRMDDEANRLQRRLSGTGSGTGSGAGAGGGGGTPAARPTESAGVRAGQGIRRGLAQIGRPVQAGAEAVAAPVRRGLGVTGRFVTDMRNTVAPPTVVAPPLNPSGPQNGRPINRRPRAGAGGVPGAPTVADTSSADRSGTMDLGQFSGDQGYQTKGFLEPAGKGNQAAPEAVYRGLQRDPQDLASRAINQQTGVARRARSQVMGGLPRDEIVRRLENSQGSYFNKGRPSARAAIAGVYADQLAAADGTSARLQEGGNRAALSGLRGATEGELAQQGAANTGVLEGQRQQGDRQLATLGSELSANQPETLVDDRGNVVVRRGLSASQVTGADGQPLRAPAAPQEGQITPAKQLEALQAEMANLIDLPMEDEARAARIGQLQGQIDGLIGVPRAPTGVPDGAVKLLRSNPDPATVAEFEAKYGQGSARYFLEG
ncbi:hypothetical protein [uncultured Arenimonas sp.]|uniref:hypothetical protein n=1 Tax=uncultured Arenimonas sp. TaxID=546226 RepID=UPI0030D917EF